MNAKRIDYTAAAEVPFVSIDVCALGQAEFDALVRDYAERESPADLGSYVYFVRCKSPGEQIKIGHAKDVYRRLLNMQVCSPYDVTLIGVIWARDHRAVEGILHERFKSARVRGEWYEPCAELLDFIKRWL